MALWARHWKRAVRGVAAALLVGSLGAFGCGKSETPKAQTKPDNRAAGPSDSGDAKGKHDQESAKPKEPGEDEFHHPFAKCVRQLDDPPTGCIVPPSGATVAGKSVYKIYKDVAAQWDGIRFTTADGKRIHYSATISTMLGEIDIELRPDLAPNHVRNFVALARAGYYDRLFFDRINHDVDNPANPVQKLDTLEAGCPLGTGEDGYGSIGYWLLPEMQPKEKATHEPGTVGACRGMEKDSAACKFYITLSEAPFLDGQYTIFGKVTRGLDVANKIFAQPVIPEDRGHYGLLHPDQPVMIQKVVIQTREGN